MEKWTIDQIKNWITDHPSFSISSKEELVDLSNSVIEIFSTLDSPNGLMFAESLAEACVKFDYDDREIVKLLQGDLDMNKDEVKIAVKEVLNEGDSVEIATLKTEVANRDKIISEKDEAIKTLEASIAEKDTLITASKNTITQLEADKKSLSDEKESVDKEMADIKKASRLSDRKLQLSEANIEFDKLTDDQKNLVENSEDTVFATLISLIPKDKKTVKKDLVNASEKHKVINDKNDPDETKDYSFVRKGSRVFQRA